jgi:hypothetical protein
MSDKMKKNEQTAPAASKRKYYTLDVDFTLSSAPFRIWVNEQQQLKGFVPESSKPFRGIKFSEPPQIKFDRKGHRGAVLDAYPVTLGIWLVSNRLKAIYERIDSEACEFLCVNVDYSNFPEQGTDYWFCYFMRELDCIDEERSEIGYQRDIAWKNYLHLIDVKMKLTVVGSAHAFRLKYSTLKLVVDDVVVDAMTAEKIRGYRFVPIQK